MKITETIKETNRWLCNEPEPRMPEKILMAAIFIAAALVFIGGK